MRFHHTKNKGDLGVLHAQVDLVEQGYGVLLPLTEHEAFDLVAYREGTFWRVQVKYRAAVGGVISLALESSWADRHGTHSAPLDKDRVDVVCIYCPDTRRCYYIEPRRHGTRVCLRIAPTRNGQSRGVSFAEDFTRFPGPLSSAG